MAAITSTSTSIPAPTKTIAIHGLPSCVTPCTSLIATLTECYERAGASGYQCACRSTAFVTEAANCVATVCPFDQYTSFATQAGRICSGIGAPLPDTILITANSTTSALTSLAASPSSTSTTPTSLPPSPGSGTSAGAAPTSTQQSQGKEASPATGLLRVALIGWLVGSLMF
ncbi:hypothetical protein QBC34DRAFT_417514 [Podospora aff. communis PSN243]|uniref:CFEM domain-containing protein n=1 Tax=Podospora aff. communis PSN243 TaxID=3040156 RepID=A0AAV9G4G2_9PEZI|nr:hypothetical protein QBC34DRAFT_417514 [Podospora aff. communis PSN243]